MSLRIVREPQVMWELAGGWRAAGHRLAFVPTMGYLHAGHLSLVRLAARRGDRVILSVFVNPAQFGPGEDLARYPRAERRDRRLAAAAGADVFYAPAEASMYPPGYRTRVRVEGLSGRLCGRVRPVHFGGVATVIVKLLLQVRPHLLLLGQKDAQQALIVRRLLLDLDLFREVELLVGPTVREADGLAMSSRNRYLRPAERRQAANIYRALCAGVALIAAGARRTAVVRRRIRAVLRRTPLVRPEYVRLVDTADLLEHDRLPREVLIAVAAQVGRARLIDNVVVQLRT